MSLSPYIVSTLAPATISAIRDHRRLEQLAMYFASHEGVCDERDECLHEEVVDLMIDMMKVEDVTAWIYGPQHIAMEEVFNDMVETAKVQFKRDLERRVLEQHATAFATRCGHKVGTREYVLAARKALEEARMTHAEEFNGERRMERAATSRACGVSGEDHYSNEDYLSSEFHKDVEWMQDVLNWLEENCPLLMLKIAEEPAPAE